MTIDALGSERHYADHIKPVWDALPQRYRGTFHEGASRLGRGNPVLVASYGDLKRALPRTAVFLEHGAGQTYGTGVGNYSGGRGRDNVELFLSPSEAVAERNRTRYPTATHAVVGCPKLDPWWGNRPENRRPVVALTFHWNCVIAPESRSAFRHYKDALPSLLGNRWEVIGHGHPRMLKHIAPAYKAAGIEVVESFDEVMRRADLLVFDNSSVGFEFAATGRPVVVLNAPWYRRDREHGLRFWEYADIGLNVDEPDQLVPTIGRALMDSHRQAQRRAEITRAVYTFTDGKSAQRAADAVAAWMDQSLEVAA